MQSVLRFFKKLYFSSNSVLKVLSKVSCNQKYCQQFLKEFDVALDQSKWHIDKCLFRHFLDIAFIQFFCIFCISCILYCCVACVSVLEE